MEIFPEPLLGLYYGGRMALRYSYATLGPTSQAFTPFEFLYENHNS